MTARRAAIFGLAMALAGCGGGVYYEDDSQVVGPVSGAGETPTAEAGEEEPAPKPASAPSEPAEFVKALPANPRSIGDGLVRSRDWKTLGWANPADVVAWRKVRSGDDIVLVVTLKGGDKDKTAISREVKLAADEDGELRMDVYNSGAEKVGIAFAVFASVDRVYSESPERKLEPGWNRVVFDLSASTFKTAASEWKNTAKLWGPGDVREVTILFYHDRSAMLAVDGIEVDGRVTEPE